MFRKILISAAAATLFIATVASAATVYSNGRFGYSVIIPPGFSAIEEAMNGDGGFSKDVNGSAVLAVWGNHITQGNFADEVAERIRQHRVDGWTITYERQTRRWASWSGSKGNEIFYQRSIPACDGAVVHFHIEYSRSQAAEYDEIVSNLVQSLRSSNC